MRMLIYLLSGLAQGFSLWHQEKAMKEEAEKRDKELARKYGRCPGCNEILVQPIHRTDCPQRYSLQTLCNALVIAGVKGYHFSSNSFVSKEELEREAIRMRRLPISSWPEAVKEALEELKRLDS